MTSYFLPARGAVPRLALGYEPRVQAELLVLGRRALASTLVSVPIVVGLVAWGYGDQVPPQKLALWLASMACVLLCVVAARRLLLASAQEAAAAGDAPSIALPPVVLLLYAIVGVGWGGISLLMAPAQPVLNAIVLVIFLGVIAAGASNVGMHSVAGFLAMALPGVLVMLPRMRAAFGEDAQPLQWGLVVYLAVVINSARNAHATLVGSVRLRLANEDLLRQKAAEAEKAERANREKSLFLAAASHDLRQPVHALLLLIEALRQRTADAGVRELVEYVHQAGATIGNLFSALMELSRLESGSQKAEPAPTDVVSLLQEAVERHRPEAQRRGLGLSLRARAGWMQTDPVLFARIVDNLLSNALRYTEQGRVLVTARLHAGRWRVEVRDTGIGIAAHEIGRIFEPYYQVANPERDRRKGLGLGMAIVAQTAQLLGHGVAVFSQPGRGSCFRIEVQPAGQRGAAAAGAAAPPSVPVLAGCRVLVIDDDPMVLHAMAVLFDGWGVDHRCVADAAQARALLQDGRWRPQAILCDYRLPGPQDGIAVLDELNETCPDASAILQSGELAAQVRDAAEEAGYLVLTKPVPAHVLGATLEAVLARR